MSTPVLMACAAWICDPGFGVGASAALEGVIQNRNDPLLFLQRREGDGERTGFSLRNIRLRVADCLGNKLIFRMRETHVIVTAGHAVIAQARFDGTLARLEAGGVQVVPDICWCSISEPVFPPQTKALMTNSGKYPHYGPGLSGRDVRFGSMADCVGAALTGRALSRLPDWLG